MIQSFGRTDEQEVFSLIQQTIKPEHTAVRLVKSPQLKDNGLTKIIGFVLIEADGETEFNILGYPMRSTAYYSVDAFR